MEDIIMKGTTHAITGALIATTILSKSSINITSIDSILSIGTIALGGGIGALIADIDLTNSKITHYITRSNSNNPFIQNIYKICILNTVGFISSVFIVNNFYPLLLAMFLSLLTITPHRTLSHSLCSLSIVVGLLSLIFTNKVVVFAIGIGYMVHLIEDMLNVTGVPLLYPIYSKKIKIPIVTSELMEYIFLIIISLFCIVKIVI